MGPKWGLAHFSDGLHNAFFIPPSLGSQNRLSIGIFCPCIQLSTNNQTARINADLLQPANHLFALSRYW